MENHIAGGTFTEHQIRHLRVAAIFDVVRHVCACRKPHMITSMLELLGVRTSVTGSGEEVLELLARMRPSADGVDSIDMVRMDCDLPGLSGHAATEAARAMPVSLAQLQIVAVTANNT